MPKYFLSHINSKEIHSLTERYTYIDEETGLAYIVKTDPMLETIKKRIITKREEKNEDDACLNEAHLQGMINTNAKKAELEKLAGLFFECLLSHENVASAKYDVVNGDNPAIFSEIRNILPFGKFHTATVEEYKTFKNVITSPSFIPLLAGRKAADYCLEENDAGDFNTAINPVTETFFKLDHDQALWTLTSGFLFDNGDTFKLVGKLKKDKEEEKEEVQKLAQRGVSTSMRLGAEQFEVDANDILNLCHLTTDSKYRPFSVINDWMPDIFDRFHGENAFKELDHNPVFANAKFEKFLKFILMSSLSEQLIDQCIDKNKPNEVNRNLRTKQYFSRKVKTILNALVKTKEFKEYFKSHGRSACLKIRAEFETFLSKSGLQEKIDIYKFNQAINDINDKLAKPLLLSKQNRQADIISPLQKIPSSPTPVTKTSKSHPETRELVSEFEEKNYHGSFQALTEITENLTIEFIDIIKNINNKKNINSIGILNNLESLVSNINNTNILIGNIANKITPIFVIPPLINAEISLEVNIEGFIESKNYLIKNFNIEKNRYINMINIHLMNIQEIQAQQVKLDQLVEKINDLFYSLKADDSNAIPERIALLDFIKRQYNIINDAKNSLNKSIANITKELNGLYAESNAAIKTYQNTTQAYDQLVEYFNCANQLAEKIQLSNKDQLVILRNKFSYMKNYGIQRDAFVPSNIYIAFTGICLKHIQQIDNNIQNIKINTPGIKEEIGFFKKNKNRILLGLGIGLLIGLCIFIPPLGVLVTSLLAVKVTIVIGSMLLSGFCAAATAMCRSNNSVTAINPDLYSEQENLMDINDAEIMNTNKHINTLLQGNAPASATKLNKSTKFDDILYDYSSESSLSSSHENVNDPLPIIPTIDNDDEYLPHRLNLSISQNF